MGRSETEEVLREWRARILNVFLAIVAVAATAMTGISIFETISRPGQWSTVILFTILTLVLAVLALFRGNDNSIRAWGVLLVPYAVGVTALASFGLGSSGRLYLLVLHIGALILNFPRCSDAGNPGFYTVRFNEAMGLEVAAMIHTHESRQSINPRKLKIR